MYFNRRFGYFESYICLDLNNLSQNRLDLINLDLGNHGSPAGGRDGPWALRAARVRAEVTGGWDDSIAVERFENRGGRMVRGPGHPLQLHQADVEGRLGSGV